MTTNLISETRTSFRKYPRNAVLFSSVTALGLTAGGASAESINTNIKQYVGVYQMDLSDSFDSSGLNDDLQHVVVGQFSSASKSAGRNDIAVASASTLMVLQNHGSGKFGEPNSSGSYDLLTPHYNASAIYDEGDDDGANDINFILSGDINGDGYDDLVTVNFYGFFAFASDPSQSDGGLFPSYDYYKLTDQTDDPDSTLGFEDAKLADMDNDGDLDLVMVVVGDTFDTEGSDNGEDPPDLDEDQKVEFWIFPNQGNGSFGDALEFSGYESTSNNSVDIAWSELSGKIAAGDFNGDNLMDVAICYHNWVDAGNMPSPRIYPATGLMQFDVTSEDPGSSFSIDDISACENLQAFVPGDAQSPNQRPTTDTTTQLAILTVDSLGASRDIRAIRWSSDWSTMPGNYVMSDHSDSDVPKGTLGRVMDYNGDDLADFIIADGKSSKMFVGMDWVESGASDVQNKGYVLGTDIHSATGGDINGDGSIDMVGVYDNRVFIYYWLGEASSNGAGYMQTYSKESCNSDDHISNGDIPSSITLSASSHYYNLKDSYSPIDNDKLASVELYDVVISPT